MDIRAAAKKTWHFLWHEDSVWSWLANLALAFILIKYVFFPVVGLIFGTPLPVVAVVSGSMDHDPAQGMLCGERVIGEPDFWETCQERYDAFNITEEEFNGFPFSGGFAKGDIMLLKGTGPERIAVGDIAVFHAGKQYPIIHRVVEKWEEDGRVYIGTMGDHNGQQIQEYAVTDGRYYYQCYQEVRGAIHASLCGPGTEQVTADVPGAIAVMDETRIPADSLVAEAWGRLPLLGYVKILFVDLLEAVGLGRVAQVF